MYAQKAIVHNAHTLHTVRNVHNAHCAYRFKVQSCDCINFVRAIGALSYCNVLGERTRQRKHCSISSIQPRWNTLLQNIRR